MRPAVKAAAASEKKKEPTMKRFGTLALIILISLATAGSVFAQSGARRTTTPKNFTLTVQSSVKGAQILINNSVKGTTSYSESLPAGNYSVIVRAQGYEEYRETVNLQANYTVRANLKQMMFDLTIMTNVNNAHIFVDNTEIGVKNAGTQVPFGEHQIRVVAEGYEPYMDIQTISRATVLRPELVPSFATLNFDVDVKFKKRVTGVFDMNFIEVYVDGKRSDLMGLTNSVQVTGGKHTIRIIVGNMQLETVENFVAGKTYSINLGLLLNIQQEKVTYEMDGKG